MHSLIFSKILVSTSLRVCLLPCCKAKKDVMECHYKNRIACKRGCSRDNGNKSEDGSPDVDVGGLFDDKP